MILSYKLDAIGQLCYEGRLVKDILDSVGHKVPSNLISHEIIK